MGALHARQNRVGRNADRTRPDALPGKQRDPGVGRPTGAAFRADQRPLAGVAAVNLRR